MKEKGGGAEKFLLYELSKNREFFEKSEFLRENFLLSGF